jgi:hypothetical protein
VNLEKQIEELKDHELDMIIEEEAPMQILCRNLSLGLATKAMGWKVAGQEGDPRVASLALGSAKNE